jgi:L-fuconolactonase
VIPEIDISGWQAALRAVAERPNVRCTLSGLVTGAHPAARPADMIAALRQALELFGPSRCTYGGDCSTAIGQRASLGLVREVLSEASAGEREQVRARTRPTDLPAEETLHTLASLRSTYS